MFGISFEHVLILGVILLVVGPRRLPELGNTMGKAIKNFKDSFSGIEEANFKRVNEEKAEAATPLPVAPLANASTTPAAADPAHAIKTESPKPEQNFSNPV